MPQQLHSLLLLFLLIIITLNEMTEGHFICVINTHYTWRTLCRLQSRAWKGTIWAKKELRASAVCLKLHYAANTWNTLHPFSRGPLWHLAHKRCVLRRKLGSILLGPGCFFAPSLHLPAAHFGLLVYLSQPSGHLGAKPCKVTDEHVLVLKSLLRSMCTSARAGRVCYQRNSRYSQGAAGARLTGCTANVWRQEAWSSPNNEQGDHPLSVRESCLSQCLTLGQGSHENRLQTKLYCTKLSRLLVLWQRRHLGCIHIWGTEEPLDAISTQYTFV